MGAKATRRAMASFHVSPHSGTAKCAQRRGMRERLADMMSKVTTWPTDGPRHQPASVAAAQMPLSLVASATWCAAHAKTMTVPW